MPVRVIGMIGVDPPRGNTLHVIAGGISPGFLAQFAQAHEDAGFDMVLVGYYSSSAEGFGVAAHAAAHTRRLGFLIAHRPGVLMPTLAARSVATFDALWGGRMALHIIAGVTDEDMQRDGDFTPKEERYQRAIEYLEVMRKTWTSTEPFDHEGQFYRFKDVRSDARPLQRPYPPLFFGGSSEGALVMGAAQCDVFAMYGEPLAETQARMSDFRQRVSLMGRPAPGFNMSFRPIVAATEGQAWDKAARVLDDLKEGGALPTRALDASAERLVDIASRGDVHDDRLWMPVAALAGGRGNSTCLVGTPEQVAQAMLRYYRLGIHSFLIRGFDPVNDVTDFGRELIPRLRLGAAEIDAICASDI